ncbi:hypothetical protein TRFO_37565 [Tritrichomonas foetus]|uniref:Uncharacterized protein n=1 Tax=Tritrichomonas foetus TaxID=1144522 RepID=A0A1J4JAQ6_9EUKA|nr:hypothetical protein TRFO_37565 [Tritrichomonas foetus]|eukprot:OHS96266.1 hypothetical protein TRFO_37565 [Tritrichomonas foetus]
MNSYPFICTKKLVNVEVQTLASVTTPDLFDFSADQQQVEQQRIDHFQYDKESVERLVSAVQGEDESVRTKYRVVNNRTRRFRTLIQSLKNQIEQYSRNLTEREANEIAERLVRELAYAIDPASRHGKMTSLFSHQKYEHPLKIGQAKFTHSGSTPVNFDVIYSFNENLYMTNHDTTLYFQHVESRKLVPGEPIQLLYKAEQLGKVTLSNGNYPSDENPNLNEIGPVDDDEKQAFMIRGFGSQSETMNLKSLINPYDFSFVDVALSLPRLNEKEATDMMTYLYRLGFLSAFIRSKVCQFIYERNSVRVWPELLGRLISLLDTEWFEVSTKQMDRCELPTVIKNLAKLNPPAMYVFNIMLEEFHGMERGDDVEFVWEFLCRSMFINDFLGSDETSNRKRKQFESLFIQTRDKPATSKTRTITSNVIEAIQQRGSSYRVPSKRFNPNDFLTGLITSHPEEIVVVLKNIPRKNEEASPLFFPLALEVREQLQAFNEFEAFDSSASETGIISNVNFDSTSRMSSSRMSSSRSKSSRANSRASSQSRSSNRTGGTSESRSRTSQASRSTSKTGSKSRRQKQEIETLSENSNDSGYEDDEDGELSASSSSHASRSSRNSQSSRNSNVSKNSHASRSSRNSQASSRASSRHSELSHSSRNSQNSRKSEQSRSSKASSRHSAVSNSEASRSSSRRSTKDQEEYDPYGEEEEYVVYEEEEEEEEEEVVVPVRSNRRK